MNISLKNGLFPSALALSVALFQANAPVMAQVRTSANFTIKADGIDSGGGASASANYAQRASAGQAFATPPMVGTNYNNQPGLQATIAAASNDTQAPSVPGGLTATTVSSSQINLSWSASSDNVAVTGYQVYRGGVLHGSANAPATSFSSSGLTPSTLYSYTVSACDEAGNCSAQSASASATTLNGTSFTPNYVAGFNLTGNSFTTPLDVLAVFGCADAKVAGVTDKVEAVWAWNPTPPPGKWKFHTPQFTCADSATYAQANHYEVLTSVAAGEGYWVSAIAPAILPAQSGTQFNYAKLAFDALPPSFNLLSIGNVMTVQQFNANVGVPPSPGMVPENFNALWTWDAARTTWYFYAPQLEQPGAPFTNAQYCTANGFQDFAGSATPAPGYPALSLQPGIGFWVEKN